MIDQALSTIQSIFAQFSSWKKGIYRVRDYRSIIGMSLWKEMYQYGSSFNWSTFYCSQRTRNDRVDQQPPAGRHQGTGHQARHQELQLQEQVMLASTFGKFYVTGYSLVVQSIGWKILWPSCNCLKWNICAIHTRLSFWSDYYNRKQFNHKSKSRTWKQKT